ncbi:tripartite motif-containing protein 29-like [Gymnodraco acuticeps]|uniref:Tripartite motif-containing protein 29-like n=1 Tax=Gymnodraco acuticeps TaxID=8218 RepID=A0A6P8UL10_GYMAC|nr:tripartite motif-containing protein 29-like [Gymnodraco acuticeps]XP_034066688.1 tripartite motif-containing protein 29-like [Gymnodraco acuticeps]XP_034066689.1 tripartite motif-containing protein 29-like [Gymnodraco acuticeps]
MSCINRRWDGEKQKKKYSCPHCRQTFKPRPALVISTELAELVEELKKKKKKKKKKNKKKKTEPQAGPSDHFDAGPGDVGCSPTGRKRKTSSLQPHDEDPLKKTKLIEALNVQENMCSQHDKVMEIFCCTDQKCICILCLNDEHKQHYIVSAAAEFTEKKKKLGVSRQNIQQRIQNEEKIVKQFQQEVDAINLSADKAVRESELTCTELVKLIEKRSSDVTQKIKSQQEYEVSRVKEIQETLQKDISDLRSKDTELEKTLQNR